MWAKNNLQNADSRHFNRLIDFAALAATFYISSIVMSVEIGSSLIFIMLAYSSILLVFVRLSKRKIASRCTPAGKSTCLIFGNAIGILIGACIVLLIENLSSFQANFSSVIILSSVMAFFVLGTIDPLSQTSLVNRCLGNYDFSQIGYFAKKRFVEGFNTLELLEQAESEREKEEIALVCSLGLEDDRIREIQLCCRYSYACKVVGCREKLKKIIEEELDRQALA